jgi:hypothetical protein
MHRITPLALAGLLATGLLAPDAPASAQSVGYVTGIPGRDPAGDDELGWGPAYRPETTFAQPGTPLTPGQIAGEAYRARTGRGVYEGVQGEGYGPAYGYAGPRASGPRLVRRSRVVSRRAHRPRRQGVIRRAIVR